MAVSVLAILAALAGLSVYSFKTRVYKKVNVLDMSAFKITGIDVSSHNGKIDFCEVKGAGYDFAVIKASEGVSFRDSLFDVNCRNALAAGLKVGAYHFFRFDSDGASQARNLMDAVAGKKLSLPLVVDVENHTNPYAFFPEEVTRNLRNMVDELGNYNYPVMLYTNKKGYQGLIRDEFPDCGLWICTFSAPEDGMDWSLWQYSHLGKAPGLTGDVDLDVFSGDETEWDAWTAQIEREISVSGNLYSAINRPLFR